MRDDFVVFIITHKRPDNQITYKTLKRGNYTGKIIFVLDDGDDTIDAYCEKYGKENIQVFHKYEDFDIGDNLTDHKGVPVYSPFFRAPIVATLSARPCVNIKTAKSLLIAFSPFFIYNLRQQIVPPHTFYKSCFPISNTYRTRNIKNRIEVIPVQIYFPILFGGSSFVLFMVV